ncbi:Holo-[acyl-carrier-protein] synthase [Ceratobasidium theobromae]|uniref:Holo-[acyl-carrier-protein] synthase n=1 Tax=Ceratobasidium theobromae TaxID=1582974 RepID=A0A5N5QPV1_9AGAM|nr:Holo-[acyl-carrier-protein] synthase [Ceratobasidium theobromae]
MILGIGVDLCHIPRVARLATNPRFAARILSPAEHTIFASLPAPHHSRFLAVRWAIKESAYKALYPTYRLHWKDLTFLAKNNNKPILQPSPNTCKGVTLHASVSHDGEYVFATVVAEHLSPTL